MHIQEKTEEHGTIDIYDDPVRLSKIVSVAVGQDFDIEAFKAALAGVKAGDYSKALENYSKMELLEHLVKRTEV